MMDSDRGIRRTGRISVRVLLDLRAQARELHDELHEVFESVTSRAAYTLGPELREFEAAFAAFCEARRCIGVGSGTDAVRLALQAAGVGPGDEVVVPANSFMATAEAVSQLGARPVFVDCRDDTALIDATLIEAAVTLVNIPGVVTARRCRGEAGASTCALQRDPRPPSNAIPASVQRHPAQRATSPSFTASPLEGTMAASPY